MQGREESAGGSRFCWLCTVLLWCCSFAKFGARRRSRYAFSSDIRFRHTSKAPLSFIPLPCPRSINLRPHHSLSTFINMPICILPSRSPCNPSPFPSRSPRLPRRSSSIPDKESITAHTGYHAPEAPTTMTTSYGEAHGG